MRSGKSWRRGLIRIGLSLLILGFFFIHTIPGSPYHWSFLSSLEYLAYDARLNLSMPNSIDKRVVIVDIDEKSLAEIGRWPWSRNIHAQLVEQLFDSYKIDLMGWDVVFAEPDQSSGLGILQNLARHEFKDAQVFQQKLNELTPRLNYDQRFADAIKGRRVVLGYAFITPAEGEDTKAGALPRALFDNAAQFQQYGVRYAEAIGYAANLPVLQAAAALSGNFNSVPDMDSSTRRVPLLFGYQNRLYESLSLAMLRLYLGLPAARMIAEDLGAHSQITGLGLGNITIPVDNTLRMLVPYRGERYSFPYISASDVLHGTLDDPDLLKDAIVLVGTTAQGLFDLRNTPVGEVYPGVEVHANMISAVRIGLAMIIFLPLLNPVWAIAFYALFSAALIALNLLLWQNGLVLPIATVLVMMLTLFLFNMSYGYFVESHSKRETLRLFGQYVPPQLVEEMGRDPDADFSMAGESREMTVLFSDVRDFTSISEQLEPKELSALMNTFLTPMTHVIHEHRGTIDKYMGDAIMAFWGAPLHDPDHARNAVAAGLDMLVKLQEVQTKLTTHRDVPPLKIGIGLNTGHMSVGNMGSEFRMAYTVLGDAVNLGSRLEGLTKQYGVAMIISETTHAAAPAFICRELDTVRVKGKDKPVAIFEPLGLNVDEATLHDLDIYHQALAAYRRQDWALAKSLLTPLHDKSPDKLIYNIYLQRIAYFIDNPPGESWDGVYVHTSK